MRTDYFTSRPCSKERGDKIASIIIVVAMFLTGATVANGLLKRIYGGDNLSSRNTAPVIAAAMAQGSEDRRELDTRVGVVLATYSGAKDAVIDGNGITKTGRRNGDRGITISGCQRLTFKNINLTNFHQGIYCNACEGIVFKNCTITKCDQGFLFSGVHQVEVRDCVSESNGRDPKGHNLYFGEWANSFSENVSVFNSKFGSCGLPGQSSFQINSESARKPTTGVLIQDTKIDNVRFAMNLLGVQGCKLRGVKVNGKVNLAKPYGKGWPSQVTYDSNTTFSQQPNLIAGSTLKRE